ncbi:MAG: phosphatidylserine decarboxylase family protein [Rhodospirillales bacterium]|nr:phosphatidylserine decarboxylase family protein [Alphaproteobacteria bacterium]MCB9986566.1 phosphatidylserine decarboxylase family protein [Rhodospirillales bacterium]USO06901.1 MAG: phosphatidylserine decarboxylase family protein [Rhodospirillales bacterium]
MTQTNDHWSDLLATIRKTVIFPVNPAGWPFVAAFAVGAAVLGFIATPLGWIGLVLTLWCLYFFRDPVRATPAREGLVVSPGCGRVVAVTPDVQLPPELDRAMDTGFNFTRISVFLSVFDVHVNRVPVTGEVTQTAYRPGKFLNAALDKASTDNEMSATLLKVKNGTKDVDVAFVQIAGWVARRIVNELAPGRQVRTGERMGLIRFGSRIDVYVPDGCVPMVSVGQSVIEGETVLADFKSKEKPREAVLQ